MRSVISVTGTTVTFAATHLCRDRDPSGWDGLDRSPSNLYWAGNNGGGIHMVEAGSARTPTDGSPMEVYVR
jgi:hypothetical protein